MDSTFLFDISRQAILVTVKIAAPCMIVALVVGVGIGLLQALTQIQEMTLTFVPKILILLLSLFVLMPFMANTLMEFTRMLADQISVMGMSTQ